MHDVVVIIENIESRSVAMSFGKWLFENESKRQYEETFYVIEEEGLFSIFYTYRKKSWINPHVIRTISEREPDLLVTVIGTNLQFSCGPSGVVRMKSGNTIDSYGTSPMNSKRHEVLNDIVANKDWIYTWFRWDGIEKRLRNEMVDQVEIGSCGLRFAEKLVHVYEKQVEEEESKMNLENSQVRWMEQEKFQLYPTIEEYEKILLEEPLSEQEFNEANVVAYVMNSKVLREIESKVAEVVSCKEKYKNPYHIYQRAVNVRNPYTHFSFPKYDKMKVVDDLIGLHKEAIMAHGVKSYEGWDVKMIYTGIAFEWFSDILESIA